MSRIERIKEILEKEFAPKRLKITDDSHRHAHHHTNPGGEETHLAVTIVSDKFDGQSRIQRHRSINQVLKTEFESGLHALKLSAYTLEEEG